MQQRQVLAESEHYRVSYEHEVVFLTRKLQPPSGADVIIGDFYGDPSAAIIDAKERFVMVAGQGLIIYYLTEPFEPYRYGAKTNQWIGLLREPPDSWWIESLIQQDEDTFLFEVDAHSDRSGTYKLIFPRLKIEKVS